MSNLKILTHTDFFFYCYGEIFLCLVHTRANIVSYLCFQFQHVALALHGVMLHTPVWEKKVIVTRRLRFVKLDLKRVGGWITDSFTLLSQSISKGIKNHKKADKSSICQRTRQKVSKE